MFLPSQTLTFLSLSPLRASLVVGTTARSVFQSDGEVQTTNSVRRSRQVWVSDHDSWVKKYGIIWEKEMQLHFYLLSLLYRLNWIRDSHSCLEKIGGQKVSRSLLAIPAKVNFTSQSFVLKLDLRAQQEENPSVAGWWEWGSWWDWFCKGVHNPLIALFSINWNHETHIIMH